MEALLILPLKSASFKANSGNTTETGWATSF
jgi:hypothetical protein